MPTRVAEEYSMPELLTWNTGPPGSSEHLPRSELACAVAPVREGLATTALRRASYVAVVAAGDVAGAGQRAREVVRSIV